jgi:hypothetical protein
MLMEKWGLPDGLGEQIAMCLAIPAIKPTEVAVVSSSSDRNDFPLNAVVEDDDSKWWISGEGSMPEGKGREHLDFDFGKKARRISFIGIKIPPMPMGPLSVREFYVAVRTRNCGEAVSGSSSAHWVEHQVHNENNPLVTLNQAEMQEIVLSPPVDTTGIRIVMTRNAVSGDYSGSGSGCSCVGLFQVCFA